jgi:ppGpp synthetase/RelA/SpoT-type nucleotidyltranferase
MIDFSHPKVVKAEVARAGKILSRPIPHDDAAVEDYARIFRVAYDWRNSHQYPMQRVRHELTGKVRKFQLQGVTAGRTKRMSSIRKKLMRSPITLAQIQDLGGCRAIVASIPQLNQLVEFYRAGGSIHEMQKDQSYIESPKVGGYRSHHFVMRFRGRPDEEAFRDRKIELQIRTKLQHAWATAVEAVGMVRNEDLKGGEGDTDWLRLFALMSSEFAEIEGCPLVPGTYDVEARRQDNSRPR